MTETRQGGFAINVAAWVQRVGEKRDRLIRAIGVELLNRMILRSPVGDPGLWKVNAARREFNSGVDHANEVLRSDPANLKKGGSLRAGLKIKNVRLYRPQGYTGGRFRGNWQLTLGAPARHAINRVDPDGVETLATGAAVLEAFTGETPIFITNNLPYAVEIEYGHSTQAPAGVVRVTAAEFHDIVRVAMRRLD